MGVAWHRFLAFFNIWFKRHPTGAPRWARCSRSWSTASRSTSSDRRPGRGRRPGRRQGRGLHLEGPARLHHLHRVRPLPVAVPGVEHRQAAVAQAAHDGPARARARQGALAAGRGATRARGCGAAAKAARPSARSSAPPGYDDRRRRSPAYNPRGPTRVIDPDVLWSCTTCGACVEQCPVDIEHVDHIVDMRRYQVLMESAFPSELGGLFKNLENNANPWGMAPAARMDWAKDLPFEVPVVGAGRRRRLSEVDYLFWVGCAGAFEDRAKKTTRAVAELLHTAGVAFAVLGDGETCTGDPARRAGNEFLFQMLAAQNVEMLSEASATKIVVTCAHCFNTLKNEYPQLGRRLRGRAPHPAAQPAGARASRPVTAGGAGPAGALERADGHLPRPLLPRPAQPGLRPRRASCSARCPGSTVTEMPRSGEKSFCCGAGGARMWMEEKLGTRINANRTDEAVATGADADRHRLPVLPGDALRRPRPLPRPKAPPARRSRWSTSPRCCWPPYAGETTAPTPPRLRRSLSRRSPPLGAASPAAPRAGGPTGTGRTGRAGRPPRPRPPRSRTSPRAGARWPSWS